MDRARGFTLVECVIVLAVAALLASAAVPSFGFLVRRMQLSTAGSDLLGGLLLTRSEAIKRRVRVVMCKSADGQSCAAAGGWQQGWIVFADANGNGQRSAAEPLLHVQPALAGSLRLTGTSSVAKYVSYAPSGATKLAGGGFQAGTLTLCSASPEPGTGRQVVINATGRPRTQQVKLKSCG